MYFAQDSEQVVKLRELTIGPAVFPEQSFALTQCMNYSPLTSIAKLSREGSGETMR